MSLNERTKSFEDLSRVVKRVFGDESGVQLEAEDLRTWTNDGMQYLVTTNKILKARATATTIPGEDTYSFPDLMIQQIETINLDGSYLMPMSFQEAQSTIQAGDPYRAQGGVPVLWYRWDDQFYLWPTPDAAHVLEVYYTRYPRPVTVPSDMLDIPDKWFATLVNYVLMRTYEMDENYAAVQMKQAEIAQALELQAEEEYAVENLSYNVVREVPL